MLIYGSTAQKTKRVPYLFSGKKLNLSSQPNDVWNKSNNGRNDDRNRDQAGVSNGDSCKQEGSQGGGHGGMLGSQA